MCGGGEDEMLAVLMVETKFFFFGLSWTGGASSKWLIHCCEMIGGEDEMLVCINAQDIIYIHYTYCITYGEK